MIAPASADRWQATSSEQQRAVALLLEEAEREMHADPPRALHLAERAWEGSAGLEGAVRATCLRARGHAHFELGQHMQSLELYDEAAGLFRAAGLPAEAARTHLSTIHSLMYLGRTTDALALGRRLRRVFMRRGETRNLARLEANLSVIHARLHRPRRALALADAASERFAALGDTLMLAQLNANRANILTHLGAFREALGAHTAARDAFAALDLRAWAATIEGNMGFLYAAQGHYNRALHALTAACTVFADLDSPKDLAQAQIDLARVYLALNLYGEAATLAAQATATFVDADMRHDTARALVVSAQARAADGDAEGALALLARAAQAFAADDFTVGGAIVALHQAALLAERDPSRAFEHVLLAEPVLARAGLVEQHGQSLLVKGAIQERLGRHQAGLAAFARARRLGARYGLPWLLAEACRGEGRLHERHDRDRARTDYEAAIAATESMRAELRSDELRVAFVRGRLGPYEDLLRLLLQWDGEDRPEELFALVERMRSRSLLDMLAGALDLADGEDAIADRSPAVDLDLRIARLREELNWRLSIIHDWRDETQQRPARRQALRAARALEEEFSALMRLRQLDGGVTAVSPNGNAVDVAAVRERLAPDQALIAYAVVDEEVIAFVVTRETIALVRRLCVATEVGLIVDRLHAGLQRRGYGETLADRFATDLQRTTDHHLALLGDALLTPLASHLVGLRRLVIVPQGPLHHVPFHALRTSSGALLDSYETVVTPSAGVWALCQDRARDAVPASAMRVLVLGVDDDQARWMVHEARTVGRLFPQADVRLGDAADVEAVRREAPTCDLLHLACHGIFRSDDPFFSALRLADGWLTVHDICALRLQARLVTLSGCQTGRQLIGPGDDLMGLARGFLRAGAYQLVVSLWMVDDASTSMLMEHFYRALLAGHGAPDALRLAQRTVRERYPHPYYWAPFIVIGAS